MELCAEIELSARKNAEKEHQQKQNKYRTDVSLNSEIPNSHVYTCH